VVTFLYDGRLLLTIRDTVPASVHPLAAGPRRFNGRRSGR
jgi:hypothetical protein